MVISDKNSEQYKWVRQFISSFIGGDNADALLLSLSDEHQKLTNLNVAVNNSLTISTSSGEYLDKVLAGYGITRPADLGLSDDAFRKIGISINSQKQITEVIHTILEIFFGEEAVRGFAQAGRAGPYEFQDGDELWVQLETGDVYKVPFLLSDFEFSSAATAQEVSDVITRYFQSQGINAYSDVFTDLSTREDFVRVYGSAKGPYSMVQIVGGRAQSLLQFPTVRATELADNSTVWQVTRNVGSAIRFRWYSGPKPALEQLFPDDIALIYGQNFVTNGIEGSFALTDVRAAGSAPSLDSGYFEVQIPDLNGLKSTQKNVIPPPNTSGNVYSFLISQGVYEDLTFFAPKKNVPYGQSRFALAFEPSNGQLKIYLPATTKVVERDLIGGWHVHMKYDENDLNGTFGSSLTGDFANKIIVVSDRAFKYHQLGFDMDASGGVVTVNAATPYDVEVDYVFREGEYTTVVTQEPHGIITDEWDESANYAIGDVVYYQGAQYIAIQANGPLTIVEYPSDNPDFWTFQNYTQNFVDVTISLVVDFVEKDDVTQPFLGSYTVDPQAKYALTSNYVTTREALRGGERRQTLFCQGALPNEEGILLFGLNKDNQEGPVRYYGSQIAGAATPISIVSASQVGTALTIVTSQTHGAVPGSGVIISGTGTPMDGAHVVSNVVSTTVYECVASSPGIYSATSGTSTTQINGVTSTVLLDPSYSFKFDHPIGEDVTVLSSQFAYVPDQDGSDYQPYVTSSPEGRIYCQDLINQIVACGINLNIIVIYPDDIGLGNAGDSTLDGAVPQSDVVWVYGGDQ